MHVDLKRSAEDGTKGELSRQGQRHFADHFYEKNVNIGQAVQKIWQEYGTVWRLEETGRRTARRDSLANRNSHILLIVLLKKIGQAVQKI